MATGDIIGFAIETNGCFAVITVEGLGTGGTYDFGMGTNNDPSSASIALTVTSEGYNASGVLGTTERTIYGVPCVQPDLGAMRQADPNDANPDETVNGSDVEIRIALSDFIYDDDTSITADIEGGWYTETGTPNNSADDYSVTNNSTLDYAKVLGNWALPQRRTVDDDFDLEFIAFHRSGIACVKFEIADEHSHTVNYTKTAMEVSPYSDYNSVLVFRTTVDCSTLTDGDQLTCTVRAYPNVGDANSVLETDDAVNSFPTGLYTDQQHRLDKTGVHGFTVIDGTGGNDGTGTVYSTQSAAEAGSAFQTIAAALTAMQTYNNANAGHNDAGGGTFLMKDGTYTFNTANGGTLTEWAIFTLVTGVDRANVTISPPANNSAIPTFVKFDNITITSSYWWTAGDTCYAWFSNCVVSQSGSPPLVYRCRYQVVTWCSGTFGNSMFNQYSTNYSTYGIIRGNDMSSLHQTNSGHMIIGNNQVYLSEPSNLTGVDLPDGGVYAFNSISDNTDVKYINMANTATYDLSHGFAIVQNLFEYYGGTNIQAMINFSGDNSTTTTNHIIIWNNTTAGRRWNMGYNDIASGGPYAQLNWSVKNNIISVWNNKDDTFNDNASATGSWPVGYWIGASGNHVRCGTTDEWRGEFPCGLYSNYGTTASPEEPGYEDDQSYNQSGSGSGDYHLTAESDLIDFAPEVLLPYDLEGTARHESGAIGCYEYVTEGGGGASAHQTPVALHFIF